MENTGIIPSNDELHFLIIEQVDAKAVKNDVLKEYPTQHFSKIEKGCQ